MVRSDTALTGMLAPVVIITQPHFGLGPLADGSVLAQPLPLDLHVGLSLLVSHEELAVTAPGLPLSVKPARKSKDKGEIRTGGGEESGGLTWCRASC